ncbi:glycoside hydrolase [Mycena vulgaris]|nr:glycoside hydrolase [Mycena vulgaris]
MICLTSHSPLLRHAAAFAGPNFAGRSGQGNSLLYQLYDPETCTPKLVVAHFIVGIVDGYTQTDWANDIALAAATGIDAFALNIGTDSWTDPQLALAYAAARSTSFKLFISFDFAASPGFSDFNNQIVPRLKLYASDAAQLQWGNGALVSTFAGDGFDWSAVRSAVGTPLEIIPFYQAAQAHQDSTDGLFMWNAWPSQNNLPIDQTMSYRWRSIVHYQSQLAGSPYMAGLSLVLHALHSTNIQQNWLYLSDTLLIDRWNQILNLQPQLVELITWNDFGESHYIGPLHPERPSVYAPSGDSDGAIQWQENIVYWYRPHPKGLSCADPFLGPPTGQSFPADGIWAATLLASPATLTMTSGTFSLTTTAPLASTTFPQEWVVARFLLI